MIPFVNLAGQREKYRFELEKAEKSVLDSGCFIGGPEVDALERDLSAYLSHGTGIATHTVTCASGTDALTIALMTLGLKPGDSVIVPDFTFIAPAECVALLGGIPKFADIDRISLQIDPECVEKMIDKDTKGIIAVDLFGQCAPFRELREIADRHGLWIIEDAAQAFGATVHKENFIQKACTLGDISITSFYPAKPLGCYGDGGAVFTANEALAQKARIIANHGSVGRYDHQVVGLNSRLDALQAAVLRVKLRHLDEELATRRRNAALYDAYFESYSRTIPEGKRIYPQKLATGNESTYAQYTILAEDRNAFIEKLKAIEIPYCIHYPSPLHKQACFCHAVGKHNLGTESSFSTAEWACKRVLSLPVCAFTDVRDVIEKLNF
ncbi:DegT/DnrJ/EryC1/StrS aminotransferase family protein [uncultured Fibrobacter sp.]|uniref:DegT/DnrJ/EryC1/StrS family aminotransferase n=1 Tax=uncultured Fibrobacter sp. TaxID=261512 RepID=UPI00260400C6|nr:DegT/DnrJ/EryC1/StrS family aminotransferase [uncultured Fibrobacter sp.]